MIRIHSWCHNFSFSLRASAKTSVRSTVKKIFTAEDTEKKPQGNVESFFSARLCEELCALCG